MTRTLNLGTCLLAVAFLATACPAKEEADGGGDANGQPDDDGDGGGSTTFNPVSASESNSGTSNATTPATTGPMDGTDDADDAGFINTPDGGITGQCSPAEQDCPKGEKCTSYVSTPGGATVDATKCVPSTGNAVAGESCIREAENDDCAPGFFCMTDVSGNTGDGFCLEYCDPGDGVCEYGGECFGFNDGQLPICQNTCDPLLQDCSPGQGCYAAFDNFVCAQPGFGKDGTDGAECATIQGCEPGLICRGGTAGCTAESGCCTPYCEVSGGGVECTDPQETCIQALDAPPPSLADVGYCGIPQ
jgi:hypothetical protein